MAAQQWHVTCDLQAIPEKKGLKVRVDERDLAVFRVGEQVFVLDGRCYHAGGPLHMGDIEDVAGMTCVRCPWHHYKFELQSGKCVGMGRITTTNGMQQRQHEAKVEGGRVYIKLNTRGAYPSDRYYTPQMERLFKLS